MSKFKLTFKHILLFALIIFIFSQYKSSFIGVPSTTGRGALIPSEYAATTDQFGIIHITVSSKPIYSTYAIILNPLTPKPGDSVQATLGLSIPYDTSGAGEGSLMIYKGTALQTSQIWHQAGAAGLCSGCTTYVNVGFTAPNTPGLYNITARVKSNIGYIIAEESLPFTVQTQSTTCPANYYSSWVFLYDTVEKAGVVQGRDHYVYNTVPPCGGTTTQEFQTICDAGFVITGTTVSVSEGIKTCTSVTGPCDPNKIVQYGLFGDCINGKQTGTDINACGNTIAKTQTCTGGCGDGTCQSTETSAACPADCPTAKVGEGCSVWKIGCNSQCSTGWCNVIGNDLLNPKCTDKPSAVVCGTTPGGVGTGGTDTGVIGEAKCAKTGNLTLHYDELKQIPTFWDGVFLLPAIVKSFNNAGVDIAVLTNGLYSLPTKCCDAENVERPMTQDKDPILYSKVKTAFGTEKTIFGTDGSVKGLYVCDSKNSMDNFCGFFSFLTDAGIPAQYSCVVGIMVVLFIFAILMKTVAG